MSHAISAEDYARIVGKVQEPDLDWDNPTEYDLTDREVLTEYAERILAALTWAGYVVQALDDLALDEFELPNPEPDSSEE